MRREITFVGLQFANPNIFAPYLQRFEEQTGIQVHQRWLDWSNYRHEITRMALQSERVDVFLSTMTLTSDLMGMNLLRPFTPGEIRMLGGAESFLPSRWRCGQRPGSDEIWAVPWIVDVRVLGYWRDMLNDAGIDETSAFLSHDHIYATMCRLQEKGFAHPWLMPYGGWGVLHAASSWIWEAGGDLLTPNGRNVAFNESPAVAGLSKYFSLVNFAQSKMPTQYQNTFNPLANREVAVSFVQSVILSLEENPQVGCTALPGGSYLGGGDLVIWSRTRDENAAFELVRFLLQSDLLTKPALDFPHLHAHRNRIQQLADAPQTLTSSLAKAALTGRAYPTVPLIGLVEERLNIALEQQVLPAVYALPAGERALPKIEKVLHTYLDPLAKRINLSLSQE